MNMTSVTAIICAFNEENTIKEVIHSLSSYSIIDEVIVINDGSSDGTREIVEEMSSREKVTAIHLENNMGKGFAMAVGVEKASGDIIVFMDADLSNILEEHVRQLITPIQTFMADMVLGQPSETLIDHNYNPFKSFTGQRALNKEDVINITDKMRVSRFGVETLLNLYYQSKGKVIEYVLLKDLRHPTKFSKQTPFQATKEFIFEGQEIAKTSIINYDLLVKSIMKNTKKYIKL